MKIIFRYIFILILLSCSQPKGIQEPLHNTVNASPRLPVWINYSKTIPDSIRVFLKIYFQKDQINVIGMKEAIELTMGQSSDIVMSKIQSGNASRSDIDAAIANSMKPVCSKLGVLLYGNQQGSELTIDSIKWDVIQMPAKDTISKPVLYTYRPDLNIDRAVILQWRKFADIVLASGLLK